jgi:hypothetical protein
MYDRTVILWAILDGDAAKNNRSSSAKHNRPASVIINFRLIGYVAELAH